MVIPTAAAVLYYGLIASDVYVSEVAVCRSQPGQALDVRARRAAEIRCGFSNAGDEIYAADEYIQSRDALRALNRNGPSPVPTANKSISVFDRFDPLGMDGSFEDLFDYFRKKDPCRL